MTSPTPDDVRAARAAAGLTQTAAAALVRSSMRAWQSWEGGQREMHPGLWELFQIKTGAITPHSTPPQHPAPPDRR